MAKPENNSNPVLVEVTRGPMVESRHRGVALALDRLGNSLGAWGDTGASVFPRSAIKMLQALPLVETGAAEHFELSTQEIALATASHNGAFDHVERVRAWLERLRLDERALECGAHEPMEKAASDDLVRGGITATALHNNCSGKHAGFLTTALHMGEPLQGYVDMNHPVQIRVRDTLEEMCGARLVADNAGIDGCNIPAFSLPLAAFAQGLAKMIGDDLAPHRKQAATRILGAMATHPELVAGSGRFDTRIMQATGGAVISKTGAEGVQVALAPDAGVVIVIKSDDGALRAAEVAMAAALKGLGLLSETALADLGNVVKVPLFNRAGNEVGVVRATPQFENAFSAEL